MSDRRPTPDELAHCGRCGVVYPAGATHACRTSNCRHCEAPITSTTTGWVAEDGSDTCGPKNRPQPHAPMRSLPPEEAPLLAQQLAEGEHPTDALRWGSQLFGVTCPVCGERRPELGPHGECPGAICAVSIPLSPFPPEHLVLVKCCHPAGHTGNHWAPIPGGGHRSWA